jgi:chromosome segregation ATPase
MPSLLEKVIDNKNKKIYRINTYLHQIKELEKIENQLGGMTSQAARELETKTNNELHTYQERVNEHNQIVETLNTLVQKLIDTDIPGHLGRVKELLNRLRKEQSEKLLTLIHNKELLQRSLEQISTEREQAIKKLNETEEHIRNQATIHADRANEHAELMKRQNDEHNQLIDQHRKLANDARAQVEQHTNDINVLRQQLADTEARLATAEQTIKDCDATEKILTGIINRQSQIITDATTRTTNLTHTGTELQNKLSRIPNQLSPIEGEIRNLVEEAEQPARI